MKFTLRATFDANPVDVNGESYLLIKRSDFATMFDGAEITDFIGKIANPYYKPRRRKLLLNPSPASASSSDLPAPAGTEPGDPPGSQTFANCVRIVLRNIGPASIGEILRDLTDSEIKADRQKIAVCLAGLKKQGDAVKQEDRRWRLNQ